MSKFEREVNSIVATQGSQLDRYQIHLTYRDGVKEYLPKMDKVIGEIVIFDIGVDAMWQGKEVASSRLVKV